MSFSFCRSNYFHVKDHNEFVKAIFHVPDVKIVQCDLGVALFSERPGRSSWPDLDYEGYSIDIDQVVFPHLVEGSVAIFMEISSSRSLDHICGSATVINSKGEKRNTCLSEIYGHARELTDEEFSEVQR